MKKSEFISLRNKPSTRIIYIPDSVMGTVVCIEGKNPCIIWDDGEVLTIIDRFDHPVDNIDFHNMKIIK